MDILFNHTCREFHMHHIRDNHPGVSPFTMQIHDCHELLYFISGRGTYYIEGNAYTPHPGGVLLMRAGEAHSLRLDPQIPYERIVVEFDPILLQTIDPEGVLTEAYMNRPGGNQNLYEPGQIDARMVHSCLTSVSKQNRPLTDAEKNLMFYNCVPPVLFEIRKAFISRSPEPFKKEKDTPVVNRLIEYINIHLCEELTLDAIASHFFMNKMHLNKLFKSVTGSTIWEYIVMKRLIMARQFIKDGMTATAAAAASGWKDYSAFYRSYRSHFHTSPTSDRFSYTPIFHRL